MAKSKQTAEPQTIQEGAEMMTGAAVAKELGSKELVKDGNGLAIKDAETAPPQDGANPPTTDEFLLESVAKLMQQTALLQDTIAAISASAAAAAELNCKLAARVSHLELMLGVNASSAAEGAG